MKARGANRMNSLRANPERRSAARVRWAHIDLIRVVALLPALVSFAACRTAGVTAVEARPPIVQPGAPGEPTQAIEMTDLLRTHSGSDVMKKLALRIELSQVDEIKMMQRWLADRGQQVPTGREHHTHGVALMPGMLTPDDMARLEAAKGVEFDRLFLEYM